MSNFEEYKPMESEYNIRVAVENLRKAYWSNEPEKVAKNFTEAEEIIISAICHHGYVVCKQSEQPQDEWIEFAKFVARGVCDDDFKDNSDCFAELACRKLVKLGILKLDGDTYKFCKADMKAVRNEESDD